MTDETEHVLGAIARLTVDAKPGYGRLHVVGHMVDGRRLKSVGHSEMWNEIGAVRADITTVLNALGFPAPTTPAQETV